jgi:hypothetical protein
MTAASSMQAMIFTAPPHSRQVSMSISPEAPTFGEHPLKTSPPGAYFWCAQLIDARRSAGVCSSPASVAFGLFPLPRLAGVTNARCWLFGANTPWKRVRLTRGLGTRAASRAIKSNGSKMTCVVPSRYGVLSWDGRISLRRYRQSSSASWRRMGVFRLRSRKYPRKYPQVELIAGVRVR